MSSNFEFDIDRVAGSGDTAIGIAGETLTNRSVVRIGANGRFYYADASAAATLPAVALTLGTAQAGENIEVLLKGFVSAPSGPWTPGSRLYVSDAAGALAHVAGTVTQEVGVARTTTMIWFDPQGIDTGGAGGVLASTTRTITAGNTTCGGWNHAQNSSDVCATPLDEPNSFWWMTIDDANNITMHIASVDLQNNHQFRVLVF